MNKFIESISKSPIPWLICIPLLVIILAFLFAFCYYSHFQDNPSNFCFHGIPIGKIDSTTNALYSHGHDSNSIPDNYFDFMYYSTQVITITGTGDISPATTPLRIVAATENILGLFFIVAFVAIVSVVATKEREKRRGR